MKKYKTEALVYLNQVKSFLEKNEQAREYFMKDRDVQDFYDKVLELSEQNLEKSGQPELSVEQFEELRSTKIESEKKLQEIFVQTKFGGFSLN